jgi:hypothetical protein
MNSTSRLLRAWMAGIDNDSDANDAYHSIRNFHQEIFK